MWGIHCFLAGKVDDFFDFCENILRSISHRSLVKVNLENGRYYNQVPRKSHASILVGCDYGAPPQQLLEPSHCQFPTNLVDWHGRKVITSNNLEENTRSLNLRPSELDIVLWKNKCFPSQIWKVGRGSR